LLLQKNGNKKDAEELLKVFNNFLTKYVTMLYVGKYNIGDYDIRRFVSLFIKDNFTRFALMKNKMNSQHSKVVFEAMNRNKLYDEKILHRRRCQADCKHDIFSMYSKV